MKWLSSIPRSQEDPNDVAPMRLTATTERDVNASLAQWALRFLRSQQKLSRTAKKGQRYDRTHGD
jgi:hypothetical protein